ncbi:cation:proton antiporter [candidate division WOR-3 bacterium]|nr:cation:proton antiporter [candidate division WOR-3 bacterium]
MIELGMDYLIILLLLFITIVLAAVRIVKGPTTPDRVVGLDTVNTTVIIGMVIFGAAYREVIYIDVAIVYALLSFISTLFIAKYLEGGRF